jgi:hypothetical protein
MLILRRCLAAQCHPVQVIDMYEFMSAGQELASVTDLLQPRRLAGSGIALSTTLSTACVDKRENPRWPADLRPETDVLSQESSPSV